jgi:hypothetical protein
MTVRPVFESLMKFAFGLVNSGFHREEMALEVSRDVFVSLLAEMQEWMKYGAQPTGRAMRLPVRPPVYAAAFASASPEPSTPSVQTVDVFADMLESGFVVQLPSGPLRVVLSPKALAEMRAMCSAAVR